MDTTNIDNTQPDQQGDQSHKIKYLSGMYENWFLDYASYVILERAVPYVNDGLKPVQRRILHAMKEMDDGRYNKVANIIGQTMQYHPHGDASIGDALVNLGQKDLLVDTQGNWGNILTGDGAAAARYIEARLSKFALAVIFNPKTTKWQLSYDGRKNEPITLPVKFPLLLAQGVEGIAVGLSSKILPHNFNELLDASIAYLKGESFEIFPDFPTGGMIDVLKYNDGARGGSVRVRARIEKRDAKTLSISQLPYGRNTTSLIDSILKANEKGKIKIKKIDDNTAAEVEILVHLAPGVSSDKTIDALYAFSDCEISISPNACIIENDKPHFIGVSEILRKNADQTVHLLKTELEIRKAELEQQWHVASLEKIFIEERIYKDKEFEESENIDEALAHIDKRLDPWKPKLHREIVRDDLLRLMEIKMARILKFNSFKANDLLLSIEEEIAKVIENINNIIPFSIAYFRDIKKKFGKGHDRKTEIRSFENIVASKVVVANEKLYIDREEGFIGTSLKKSEYICDCSDIDEVIIFRRDGSYFVTKVSAKAFIGKNILHLAVFKKNDKRTIYNLVYRHGKSGETYMKRFAVTAVTRDKEYMMTQGAANSRIFHFSSNPNGEAEVLKVVLKPKPRLKKLILDIDLADLAIKGRQSRGNLITKNEIHKITVKEKGVSTLGGRKIWFDQDVKRLNADSRGQFLGEFHGDDKIMVIDTNGSYELYNFDLTNHFHGDILSIQKLDPRCIFSVVFWDEDQGYYYLKRFDIDGLAINKPQVFIGTNPKNKMVALSLEKRPQFEIFFGGASADRPSFVIDAEEHIALKSLKARGKRITTLEVSKVVEIDPLPYEEPEVQKSEIVTDEDHETEIFTDADDIPMDINRGDSEDKQMNLFSE